MSRTIYDNWGKLVGAVLCCAVLRREEDRQLCHAPSISSSTRSSNFSFSSHFPDFNPSDFSASSSSRQLSEVEPQVSVENSSQVSIFGAAEQVYVNEKPLNSRELEILLRCPNPPSNLKPGSYYWYDKYAGSWGKQGYKPSQIISVNLRVGGSIDAKASNGDTSVYINNREITIHELWMLKFHHVKCPRGTRLWIHEDGSYEVEGTGAIRGNIWNKASTKLVCSLINLPFPRKKSSHASEDYAQPHASEDYAQKEEIKKILLIGYGTTNFLKRAIYLFSPDILYYEDIPSTFSDTNFSFSLPDDDYENKLLGYQLIAAPQEVEDDYESLEMIEDVRIVMFSLPLTDYDRLVADEHGTNVNKMNLNKKLFENVATLPSFDKKPFLLLLTAKDRTESPKSMRLVP